MSAVVTVSFRPPSSPRAARGRARPRRGPGGPPSGARGRAPDRPARERARPRTPIERLEYGPGEGHRLCRRDEPPALVLAQEVRRPAHAGRHHRPRRRQRLDERHRRPLVARGVHHHVEVAVDRGEVALPAEERHLAVEAQLAAERLERRPLLAVAHEREADVGSLPGHDPRGPQERGHVLDRHEAAHHPHERRRLGDPRLASQHAPRQHRRRGARDRGRGGRRGSCRPARCRGPPGPASPPRTPPRARRRRWRGASPASGRGPSSRAGSTRAARGRGRCEPRWERPPRARRAGRASPALAVCVWTMCGRHARMRR